MQSISRFSTSLHQRIKDITTLIFSYDSSSEPLELLFPEIDILLETYYYSQLPAVLLYLYLEDQRLLP